MKKFITLLALSSFSLASFAGDIVLYKCSNYTQLVKTKETILGKKKEISSEKFNLCVIGDSRLMLSSYTGESTVQCRTDAGTVQYNYVQKSQNLGDGNYEIKIGISLDEGQDILLLTKFIVNENDRTLKKVNLPLQLDMTKTKNITTSLKNVELSCYIEKR
jgi:hypothetical protein